MYSSFRLHLKCATERNSAQQHATKSTYLKPKIKLWKTILKNFFRYFEFTSLPRHILTYHIKAYFSILCTQIAQQLRNWLYLMQQAIKWLRLTKDLIFDTSQVISILTCHLRAYLSLLRTQIAQQLRNWL